ncbi:MAG: helix-turn-helix domain-containing protein [Clostridiales bacterium]|nr:helix-turn-helix domain-containing protein [Clostridiales bacterium]
MDYYRIGARIKEMRMKQGMTQESLAEKADISTNFLACIEIGKRKGSFETYAKIVEALGTSFDYITQDSIKTAKTNTLKEEMVYYFDKCSVSKQALIIKLAEEVYRHEL